MTSLETPGNLRTILVLSLTAMLPITAAHAESSSDSFRIVGYLPDYRLADYDLSRAHGLTDLIVFSAEPAADGSIDLTRLKSVPWTSLQRFKTQQRIRLILCIGGWDRSKHFADIATSPGKTDRFAESVVRLCLERRFDGVDIDWEHPHNEAEQTGYGRLLSALNIAFDRHGLVLSVTVAAWQQLPKEGIDAVDWVNVMAYDHDGPHSTFDGAKSDVNKLLDAGVPPAKLTLGIPFYGRHIKNRDIALSYREIVAKQSLPPESDEVDQVAFNGPVTIADKTNYAIDSGLAGVMVWELGQDTDGDASLLNIIRKTSGKRKILSR